MSQVIGYLFQCPASFSCSMGEVVAQIMKGKVSNLFPLVFVCPQFECTKPMMNARFRELLISLRGKEVGTLRITSAMLKIREEGSPSLIEQINITEFARSEERRVGKECR